MLPRKVRRRFAAKKATELSNLIKTGPLQTPFAGFVAAVTDNYPIHFRFIDGEELDDSFGVKFHGQYTLFITCRKNPAETRYEVVRQVAHVCLNHYELKVDGLTEDNLTDQQRKILEQEADVFVNALLTINNIEIGDVARPEEDVSIYI